MSDPDPLLRNNFRPIRVQLLPQELGCSTVDDIVVRFVRLKTHAEPAFKSFVSAFLRGHFPMKPLCVDELIAAIQSLKLECAWHNRPWAAVSISSKFLFVQRQFNIVEIRRQRLPFDLCSFLRICNGETIRAVFRTVQIGRWITVDVWVLILAPAQFIGTMMEILIGQIPMECTRAGRLFREDI